MILSIDTVPMQDAAPGFFYMLATCPHGHQTNAHVRLGPLIPDLAAAQSLIIGLHANDHLCGCGRLDILCRGVN